MQFLEFSPTSRPCASGHELVKLSNQFYCYGVPAVRKKIRDADRKCSKVLYGSFLATPRNQGDISIIQQILLDKNKPSTWINAIYYNNEIRSWNDEKLFYNAPASDNDCKFLALNSDGTITCKTATDVSHYMCMYPAEIETCIDGKFNAVSMSAVGTDYCQPCYEGHYCSDLHLNQNRKFLTFRSPIRLGLSTSLYVTGAYN